jgi:hypothetical protein
MTKAFLFPAALIAVLMAGCVATNTAGITRPSVPPATADRWTTRYNDGAGNPTLATANIAWVEAVIGSNAGMNLVADCRLRDAGPGMNLSLERDRLPRDAFLGEAVNLSVRVISGNRTIRRESVGTVPFDGFGVDQSGGYRFKPSDRLIRAMRNGSVVILEGPTLPQVRFSLNGSGKLIRDLGCVR